MKILKISLALAFMMGAVASINAVEPIELTNAEANEQQSADSQCRYAGQACTISGKFSDYTVEGKCRAVKGEGASDIMKLECQPSLQ